MGDYSTSLRRSLFDRAGTLGSYVDALQSSHSRSDDSYSAALSLFRRYTELIVRHVQEAWSYEHVSPERRSQMLNERVADFFLKEKWFDERFARGRQSDVPRALQTLARRELRGHGLNSHEPVLTVGPPNSFETHRSDLHSYLFGGLHTTREDFTDLPPTRLAIISVPYIEGTRSLWYPISIGHELAHIRLEAQRGRLPSLDVAPWIDPQDHELVQLSTYEGEDPGTGVGILQKAREMLRRWVDEILCDLNAVRLYGPAGMSAIGEFLGVALQPEKANGPSAPTFSHPSLSLRLSAMFHFLKRQGIGSIPSYLEPWTGLAESGAGTDIGPNAAYLQHIVQSHLDDIAAHAATWGEVYHYRPRNSVVRWLRDELINGVPGGTHCLGSGQNGTPTMIADVVNASWEAREFLDDSGIQGEHGGAQNRSDGLTSRNRRLILDNLSSKAVDTLEFVSLWGAAGKEVSNLGAAPSEPMPPIAAGVLGRWALEHRLRSRGERRVVVTPLLAGSVQDAGIDLRLSPDFIVFRHSATAAFDPLRSDQDPRTMQEAVVKAWGEPFILHPDELVLASTLEYVVLPQDVCGQVVTRSSYGRLGLITATAVQIQPGSRSCITLELVNHGETPIVLTPGVRIAQLVLSFVAGGSEPVDGKYWYPVGPEFSKAQSDEDSDALRFLAHSSYRSPSDYRGVSRSQIVVSGSMSGPFRWATDTQSLVISKGGNASIHPDVDLSLVSDQTDFAQIFGSTDLVTYVVTGSMLLPVFVSAVLGLVRGLKRGCIVRVGENGKVQTTPSDDVARGFILLIAPGGETQLIDAANQHRLVSIVEKLVAKPRADGRWTDPN
jgi:deoxycytidine triphosphate deaminase